MTSFGNKGENARFPFSIVRSYILISCNGSSVDTVKEIEANYNNVGKSITLIGEFDALLFNFSSDNQRA
jgi:uroporphyrinogen-III decarboxylase